MSSRVGRRSPTYCTGLGKALIAYEEPEIVQKYFEQKGFVIYTPHTIRTFDELLIQLQEIRKNGYAFDLGEHELDVRCIAAPLFNSEGKVVAAISISGPVSRFEPLNENVELINCTLEAANRITKKLKNHLVADSIKL
jgi:IclR family KDG regulon transcriptional repressor